MYSTLHEDLKSARYFIAGEECKGSQLVRFNGYPEQLCGVDNVG